MNKGVSVHSYQLRLTFFPPYNGVWRIIYYLSETEPPRAPSIFELSLSPFLSVCVCVCVINTFFLVSKIEEVSFCHKLHKAFELFWIQD